jgi:hypothetical protein
MWTAVKLARLRGECEDESKYLSWSLPENSDPVYGFDGELDEYTIGGIRYRFDGEKYVCEKGFCIWLNGFIERYESQ